MSQADRLFVHDLQACAVPDVFGFKEDVPSPNQELIVERIIACYDEQKRSFSEAGLDVNADMWRTIAAGYRPFEERLEAGDVAAVSETLINVCRGPLVTGFMNYRPYNELTTDPNSRALEVAQFIDKLLALAEALGTRSVQCPEQGDWGYRSLDLMAIVAAIQTKLPMELRPPTAGGGAFGMSTGQGVLCNKDLFAMYTTVRAYDLLSDAPARTVCEIGGGTGTLAYYLAQAGMEVSVYDLPIVSLVQAYYAMKSLGPDEVWLCGEEPRAARVRLLPYWQLADAPDRHFELIINQDSLPEIEVSAALEYLRLFREKGTGLFLSINQEARARNAGDQLQSVVSELAQRSGFGRRYRFPHWMRAGYVEELYSFN